jgi:hypothetical protein
MYWYADIDYIPESIDEPSSQVFAQWVNWNGIIIIKLYNGKHIGNGNVSCDKWPEIEGVKY